MEELNTDTLKVFSGGIDMDCRDSPCFFRIDSLIENCSIAKKLDDRDAFFSACIGSHKLVGINDFDFKVTEYYKLEWNNTPISQRPVEAKTILQDSKYIYSYFYHGYEIQISENQFLTLLFFDAFITNNNAVFMVWEYVETE